jgi:very-short-patch-repair endonuclease
MEHHKLSKSVWSVAQGQDGAIGTDQLLALGMNHNAIEHRVSKGRLHPKWTGVFAVGRPELSQRGLWIAALLTCGPHAALSDGSAMAYYSLGSQQMGIEICVPYELVLRRPDITIHRRRRLTPHHVREAGPIRVTSPALTLVDFARNHARDEVEDVINAADRKKLISAPTLRRALEDYRGWPGVRLLRSILDRRTFTLTQSHLERLFIPIAVRAGLPRPLTQQWVNGYRVDFYWPELGLVVETDGGKWHASAAQQTADRRRDQAHTAAGLTALRFTHAQIRYESGHVGRVLGAVAARRKIAS